MVDGRQILVVDDDTDLRETLGELLTEGGFDARLAENGRVALEVLRSGTHHPRLILLDLMMPEMNGWQFREEQLKDEALREIPVIVMTAKPVGLGQLLEAVERNAR